jgi:outer membrane protein OmpA-like peptidoglycan-associated protein
MASPIILCVLSDEQRAAYEEEFSALRGPGLEFLFKDDPEEALEQIPAIAPHVVVVGMEVGPMEGLEFLYNIRRMHADFERPVVVLPDKGDPFPPVIHTHDRATGRSNAEQVDLAAIVALIEKQAAEPAAADAAAQAPQPAPAAAAPAPEPAAKAARPTPAPAAPAAGSAAPAAGSPQPAAATPSAPDLGRAPRPVISTERAPLPAAPAPRSRAPAWLFVVVALVLLGAAAGVIALVAGGGGPGPAGSAGNEPGSSRTGGAIVGGEPAAPQSPEAGRPAAPADAAPQDRGPAAEPSPGTPPPADLPAALAPLVEGMDLPFSFRRGSSYPTVADEVRIAEIVTALREHPEHRIELAGHTSADGTEMANQELGLERAQSVRRYLAREGVDVTRISITSYGSESPAAPNQTEEGQSRNRRVTARILR